MYQVNFKRLSRKAVLPKRGTPEAAGLDLSAIEARVIAPGKRALIRTGWAVKVPTMTYGRIAPRSGLAHKHGIDVMAGVIDRDYRGEVGVILINKGEYNFEVNEGDRVAQLIIEHCSYAHPYEVEDLDETERGEGGYGSTEVMV